MDFYFWSATVRFLKQFQLDSIVLKEKDELMGIYY
tara:strand:+ start:622 stop:726 length:105 start_codon:yes stop_codon:yes gene_type:complete